LKILPGSSVKHTVEYLAVKILAAAVRPFPFPAVMWIGKMLGDFLYFFLPYRKRVALLNIRTAFPEKNDKETLEIYRKTCRNFSMTLFEYFSAFRLSREKILQHIEFDSSGVFEKFLKLTSGSIAVTGHFGSFELLGVVMAARGIPLDAVVKPMKNPKVEKFLDHVRSKNNYRIVKTKEGFSKITGSIQNNRMIALISDQDAGKRGLIVKFFGIDSSTPAGPAVLAIRTGAPMIAGFLIRKGTARYKAEFHEISYDGLPEDPEEKITEITQRYTTLLESYIRKYPDHYFWFHKRWKSAGLYNPAS